MENGSMKTERFSDQNNRLKDISLFIFGLILCAVPLGVMANRYAQLKATVGGNNTTTSSSGSSCDNTLTAGWYRFVGGAGKYLSINDVSRDTCNTWYGGSFNGSLPSIIGSTTNGTLCLNNNGYLCYSLWSGSTITITNCNGFYVYYLLPINHCNARYCTTY